MLTLFHYADLNCVSGNRESDSSFQVMTPSRSYTSQKTLGQNYSHLKIRLAALLGQPDGITRFVTELWLEETGKGGVPSAVCRAVRLGSDGGAYL